MMLNWKDEIMEKVVMYKCLQQINKYGILTNRLLQFLHYAENIGWPKVEMIRGHRWPGDITSSTFTTGARSIAEGVQTFTSLSIPQLAIVIA